MSNYYRKTEDIIYLSLERYLRVTGNEDIQILNSHMNALEPDKTYVVFTLLNLEQIGSGSESIRVDRDDETLQSISHHHGEVQIQVIGEKSSDIAGLLSWGLGNDRRAYDSFAYNKIRVFNIPKNIRRAPQKRDTQWVEGYSFDFKISLSLNTKYKYDWVEYVVINGEKHKVPYSE